MAKNPGIKLFFSQFGGEQPIPPEFIAAMGRAEEIQAIDNSVGPEALSDTIVESRTETNRTNERVRHTIKKNPGSITLRAVNTDDNGRPVQVVRTLYRTGTVADPQPTATTQVAIHDLGNGWSISEVGTMGSYIGGVFTPGVFAGNEFKAEKPVLTPQEFLGQIPQTTTRVDAAGTAVAPTLTGSQVSQTQEQITDTKKRTTIVSQTPVAPPVLLNKGKDTNDKKQVVSVARQLVDENTVPATPTALQDVSFKQLGDGTAVQETRTISIVFDDKTFTKEIVDVVPDDFKSLVASQATELISAGTAASPTLGVNDISATQKQLDAFTILTRTLSRADVLPVNLVSKDTNDKKQVVTVTRRLRTIASGETAAVPSATQDVVVQNLGDGLELQTVRAIQLVFDAKSFTKEILDVIPEDFKALVASQVTELVSSGTAASPTLGANDISATQKQLDAFTVLTRTLSRVNVLPVSIVNKDTNDKKQIVTVTRTLRVAGSGTVATPSATQDVVIQVLGDGHEVQTVRSIGIVFDAKTFTKEIVDVVPEDFKSLVASQATELISSGTAVMPTLGAADISATQKQLDAFTLLTRTLSRADSLPIALVSKDTNDTKQIVTVTRTLRASGSGTVATPSATQDVTIQQLGDNLEVQTVRSVSAVFDHTILRTERPVVTPDDFKALIPSVTTQVDSSGTIVTPALAGTKVSESQEQMTSATKRVTVTTQDVPALGTSLNKGRDTNQAKQVVTVTRKLLDDASLIDAPSATQDVVVKQLGDGTKVQETRSIPAVFSASTFTKEIVDAVPEDFKAAVATQVTELVAAGTAAMPTLGTGDLSATQKQLDAFTILSRTLSRADVFPVSLVSKDTNDKKQIITVTRTLRVSGSGTVATPSATQDVVIQQLGDGHEVQTVRSISLVFDARTFTKEIVDIVPEDFKSLVASQATELISSGTAVMPTLGATDISATQKQLDAFTLLTRTLSRADVLPVSLVSKDTNDKKQVVTVTRTLRATGGSAATPSATQDTVIQQLGDGLEVQTIRSISAIFTGSVVSTEIPDPVPDRFKIALPTTQTRATSTGTVASPALATNELKHTEEQIDAFNKVLTSLTRAGITLPVSLTSKRTNEFDQIVTVTDTYRAVGTAPVASPTQDIKVVQLGDGNEVVTTEVVTSVFGDNEFVTEGPDPVPEKFRLAVPDTVETTQTVADATGNTASAPTLGANDIRATQKQLSIYKKLLRTLTRTGVTLPISLTSQRINDREQIVTVTETYQVVGSIPSTTATTHVSYMNLGDGKQVVISESIPSVYANTEYVKEVPDFVPQEFRPAVPLTTTSTIVAGLAAVPTLGTGDLRLTEKQVTALTKMTEAVTRAGITLPITLTSYETDNDGLLDTVDKTLKVQGTATTPTALKSVKTQNLGNGWMIEEVITKPSVFSSPKYSVDGGDLLPDHFRGFTSKDPTLTSTIVAGSAATPTLADDDINASEQAVDTFRKRVDLLTRAGMTFPVTVTGQRQSDAGYVVTVTEKYQVTGSAAIPTPTATKKVTVVNLTPTRQVVVTEDTTLFTKPEYVADQGDIWPPEFKAKYPIQETSGISTAVASMPSITDFRDIRASSEQLDAYTSLSRRFSRSGISALPIIITNYETDEAKNVITVERKIRVAGGTAYDVPSSTQDVVVQDLGDGNVLQTKKSIPTLFPRKKIEVRNGEVFPEEFLAYPGVVQTLTEQVVAGTSVSPALADTNDLLASEEQLTAFTKLSRVLKQDITYPVLITKTETDDKGRVVTIVRALRLTATTGLVPTATKDVATQILGDGTVLETTRTVPAIFDEDVQVADVPDNLPAEFRRAFPATTDENLVADASAAAAVIDPVATPRTIFKSEQRLTSFLKRVRTVTRAAITTGTAFVHKVLLLEFGGSTATRTTTLSTTVPTLDQGLEVVSSKVEALGDGRYIKETIASNTTPAWPVLSGSHQNEDGSTEQYQEQVVAAGTQAGPTEDITPIDQWRSKKRTSVAAGSGKEDYSNFVRNYPGYTNVDWPAVITAIAARPTLAAGSGNYSASASFNVPAGSSGEVTLHGEARGSASVMVDLDVTISRPKTTNVRCVRYFFYAANGQTNAQLLTRLNTITASTVLNWPAFRPVPITVVCQGVRRILNTKADASARVTTTVDFEGTAVIAGQNYSNGLGTEYEVSVSQTVVRLPEAINAGISITGLVDGGGTSAPVTASATARSSVDCGSANGALADTTAITVSAIASVAPTTVAATQGTNAIPTSGLYLHRITCEPAKNLLIRVSCEVIDVANL